MREPWPRSMNLGTPPTPRKARTGELTPPGITFWARANQASDRSDFMESFLRGDARVARDHMLQEELHRDFLQRSVDVFLEAVTQAQVRLRTGKQILHQVTEAWAPPHEF